ncbi:cytochrome P450 [Stutzerimonas nosocomialis]|uniref:Cytochrome P450 n=1 Tax=Stutzerimonas nosocomialis TaxID=1056496 RepID=A0A5R9QKA6_9GAMM|nr:cytochrome P450 [Stutzerimonas nosocomialis]TLX65402.1 cytochrome P450 [Stutzerimonas nosocomialis]
MTDIPRDDSLESSTALLREGYTFIRDRCRALGSDVFQTRLLMQNTLCMSGEEAARLFYDKALFQRAHAAPRMLQQTLFGRGGVQGLDGDAHLQRKRLFVSLLDDQGVAEMVRLAQGQWEAAIERWCQADRVVLLIEAQRILTQAACQWAAVPLGDEEVEIRRAQLAAMIDGAGGIGARHWQARKARREAERWTAGLIEQVRAGTLPAPAESALQAVATHRDANGERLDTRIAAVELLNLLRPTVAVSRFIVYAALELLAHPEWRQRLADGSDEDRELFAQEVRRLYAFFPFTAARVRKDFEWKGYHFAEGTRVMLDLYGTNRDPRNWQDPEHFHPERFEQWDGNPYSFITQGGADAATNHRCPGERLSIELLKLALRMLTQAMTYGVPAQDLRIDTSRMPAQPESCFVISDVRRR